MGKSMHILKINGSNKVFTFNSTSSCKIRVCRKLGKLKLRRKVKFSQQPSKTEVELAVFKVAFLCYKLDIEAYLSHTRIIGVIGTITLRELLVLIEKLLLRRAAAFG